MLLVNDIKFSRSEKIIYENINFSASPGKIIFIKGSNGSGKTTLLKSLVNIIQVDSGEIFWKGKNINKNIFSFYKYTSFIMDKPTSTLDLTLVENINYWKKLSSSKITDEGIEKLLTILNIDQYLNNKIAYLSQGEIKKLELTRLIIEQKKLWILDEPFSGLDDNSIEIINDTLIDHISNDGIVIFASHYIPNLKNLEIVSLS